ncbi:MAG TPA: transposase [Streptosporangiaceae bacterium]
MRVLTVGYNFLPYGCDQDFLLPPDARDWLPAGHLSWAVIDAAGELDLGAFLAYYRSDGKGRPAYHPKMMTSLVLYCYCKGIRSSRAVEMACLDDVGCRVITGNLAVDHATVARFVRRHRDALTGLFVQVLAVCAREGLVTVDLVAGDGTKVKASASKASSRTLGELDVSIGELQKALEAEVSAWWRQADLLDEQEDSEQATDDAASGVPAAARTRKRTADRLARAQQAREMLTERHGDTSGAVTALEQARQRAVKAARRLAEETTAHQQKLDRHQASQQAKAGGNGGRAGRPPKPMDQAAKVCAARAEQERAAAALQRALADPNKGNVPKGNTTDPHCRIMPAKAGGYMCARNLQGLANDQQVILALLLHDNSVDAGALHPLLKAGRANLDAIGMTRPIGTALFDAGYASEANFTAECEARLLVAIYKEAATCGRDQASGKTIPAAWEGMADTMSTPEAKEAYKKRQSIIEPIFGQLFERMGRNLNYRGEMACTELHLWGTTHNLLKCFRARQRSKTRPAARETVPSAA